MNRLYSIFKNIKQIIDSRIAELIPNQIAETSKYSYIAGVLTSNKTKIALMMPVPNIQGKTATCNGIDINAYLVGGSSTVHLTQSAIESISCTSLGIRIVFTYSGTAGTNNTPVVAVINSCDIIIS